ncbi:myb family transcription factor family protein [Dorcoceras hygrometricum]|uniref:Myb family transcription factor family protein n=1 Tax=Dorcoceras hygrometricum TaxID=472368 RepID=A0A2Z7D860_9LAMI|nr:myb family transcription factor family protein [Dorcoceras hygrometricum]
MLHAAPEMMTPSSELSFDCKPYVQPTQKLEEFLARLEEERLKIDAFKRELPLCMQLLNNAMEASRQQLQSQQSLNEGGRPVLEEFIPLRNTSSEITTDQNNNSTDKANWMTSAQLWNQESETRTPSPKENNDHIKIALSGKQRVINGGAFVPFTSKERTFTPFPELALASSVSQKEEMELEATKNSWESNSRRENSNNISGSEKEQVHGAANTTSQAQRKARRCWSPDLHRRFVNALQMLGGSQLATPKQIRELMKVDGLTNDEKYRLHTRRPSPNSQSTPATPQVVVLGGIWVPPEYAAAAAAAHGGAQATALYGQHTNTAHHVSPVFCSAPPHVAHEMYPAIAAPPQQSNRHMHHHQLHVYNKPGNSSPDSDAQGGAGDQSESIEDGKSESGSWKADSAGENGGERKRQDGEESNASVIMSLKF